MAWAKNLKTSLAQWTACKSLLFHSFIFIETYIPEHEVTSNSPLYETNSPVSMPNCHVFCQISSSLLFLRVNERLLSRWGKWTLGNFQMGEFISKVGGNGCKSWKWYPFNTSGCQKLTPRTLLDCKSSRQKSILLILSVSIFYDFIGIRLDKITMFLQTSENYNYVIINKRI